jgi:hypothetical protein
MTRKLWVFATVTLFGVSAVLAGIGLARNASACDDTAKTAAATTRSCCAKDGAQSASADAGKFHHSVIKSAVVAPGAAPILNVAAFGGMLAGGGDGDCDWCPGAMSQEECEAMMSAAGCPAMKGAAYHATTAAVVTAGHPECNQSAALALAGGDGCSKSSSAAAGDKSASAAAAEGCCEGKSASATGADKCATVKSASLKGVVDDMPYRENKRVVLAGAYACGHCTLDKTADCTPMLKTADGKIYPLLQNNRAKEMRSTEGKNIEVSGTVKKLDGVKFLDVKSYRVL